MDISPEQITLARPVTPKVHEANVLDWLKNTQARFDLITGLDSVERFHKPEVLPFVDACFLARKPRGKLVLQTPNAGSLWGGGRGQRYGDFTYELRFNSNSLIRLLKLAGFEYIELRETRPVTWGYSYRSSIRYIMWQPIRMILKLWNSAETGGAGNGVFTRNFLISATEHRILKQD